jgi:hypothetical protein
MKIGLKENGLLYLETRLSESQEVDAFVRPLLLPADHWLVIRLAEHIHLRLKHAGIGIMLSNLRNDYWIMKGRKMARQIVRKCVPCRRMASKPFSEETPSLPVDRCKMGAIFETVGVDYAGPLYLRNNQKVYIVVFTCAVYRALHLELAESLSTEAFLMAFQRFVARRGRPRRVFSDNGTNFIGAANLLKEIDWQKVQQMAAVERIDWTFNPPAAPWWGGFWERLVRSVKELLRRTLGSARLSAEELYTVLAECESVLNSRPLTFVSEGPDLVPLTPASFLLERKSELPEMLMDNPDYPKAYRTRVELMRSFRARFRTEYLGLLIHSSKNQREVCKIKVGNVVLIESDGIKRLSWPIGLVVSLIPGRDGRSRVAKVKVGSGFLIRPIQRLHLLECGDEVVEANLLEVDEPNPEVFESAVDDVEVRDSDVPAPEDDPDVLLTIRSRRGRPVLKPARFRD